MIELVIDITHPENKAVEKPDIPSYMPLKLSLIGYSFSGKKTLAGLLHDKYKVHVISVEELINECVDIVGPEHEEEKMEEDDYLGFIEKEKRMKKRKLLLEDKEYRALGDSVLHHIKAGLEIPNDIYLKLIIHKIKRTFPSKTDEEFVKEYFSAIGTGNPANKGAAGENTMSTEKERVYKEIMENKFKYTAGWCLLDFPLNYDQAQEIEKYLTGFLVENDKEVPISETLKSQARILAQATPRETARRTVKS